MNLNSNHHQGWRTIYILGLGGLMAIMMQVNYASGFVYDKDVRYIMAILGVAIGREVVPRFVGKGDGE